MFEENPTEIPINIFDSLGNEIYFGDKTEEFTICKFGYHEGIVEYLGFPSQRITIILGGFEIMRGKTKIKHLFNKLYKLLPVSIKNKINMAVLNIVRQDEERKAKIKEASIPQIELTAEYIKNLTIVTNKVALLDVLPKHSIVAEVGVSNGKYSEKILSVTQPKKLHLIDSWAKERYKDRDLFVEKRFEKEIKLGQVFIYKGFSTTELERFDDGYFDWVYIDTNHTYDTTAKELEICRNKVKTGGLIAGHDYAIGNWDARWRYGVIEAVNEFCVKYNWEMLYLTHESHRCLSYALRQISM